jgi:hypothetical protein
VLSGSDEGAQGTMGGPNRPGQRAQDLQGRLIMSGGHGYPLDVIDCLFVTGFWGVGEGETDEAAGNRCQSVTGVGPPWFPHRPGVQTRT